MVTVAIIKYRNAKPHTQHYFVTCTAACGIRGPTMNFYYVSAYWSGSVHDAIDS